MPNNKLVILDNGKCKITKLNMRLKKAHLCTFVVLLITAIFLNLVVKFHFSPHAVRFFSVINVPTIYKHGEIFLL